MFAFLLKLLLIARTRLKSRASLEAENLALRQQVIVLSRKSQSRMRLGRSIVVDLRLAVPIASSTILECWITVVRPETVIRWHRRGFRANWRWKSRRSGGRPRIDREIRDLIRRTNKENPQGGSAAHPRRTAEAGDRSRPINRGEVLPTRRQGPPSQGWKTFLRNHAAGIASIDLLLVRTISFKLLYGLVVTPGGDW